MDSDSRNISNNKSGINPNDIRTEKFTGNSSEKHSCSDLEISSHNQSSITCRLIPLDQSQDFNLSESSCSGGQVLVMMPNNNIDNQNLYSKRTGDTFSKSVIDQKRRIMHKEIERKRRDKINDWIIVLSKQVPDCASDHTKQGQSKGGILAKTAKYIQELRDENERLNSVCREKEGLSKELERARQKVFTTETENRKLKSLLKDNNITFQ